MTALTPSNDQLIIHKHMVWCTSSSHHLQHLVRPSQYFNVKSLTLPACLYDTLKASADWDDMMSIMLKLPMLCTSWKQLQAICFHLHAVLDLIASILH